MSTIPNSATSTTKTRRVGKYKSNVFDDRTVDYWQAWFLLFLQAFRGTTRSHRKYTIGGNHIHIVRKPRRLGCIDRPEENFCDGGRRDMWACTNREAIVDWQCIQKDSKLIIGYIPSQDVSRPLPLKLPKTDLGHRYFEVTETSTAMISMISTLGVVQICRPTIQSCHCSIPPNRMVISTSRR